MSFCLLLWDSQHTAASCRVSAAFLQKLSLRSTSPSLFLRRVPPPPVRAPPPNWVEDNTLPWQLLCAGPGATNCFFAHTSRSRSVHYSTPPRRSRSPGVLLVPSSFALFVCVPVDVEHKVFPFTSCSVQLSPQIHHAGICCQNGETLSKQSWPLNCNPERSARALSKMTVPLLLHKARPCSALQQASSSCLVQSARGNRELVQRECDILRSPQLAGPKK